MTEQPYNQSPEIRERFYVLIFRGTNTDFRAWLKAWRN